VTTGKYLPRKVTSGTYFHSTAESRALTDNEQTGLKTLVSMGQTVGGKKGFTRNTLMMFKSGFKSDDYHSDVSTIITQSGLRQATLRSSA
jgi:hypothetical protein